MANRIGFTLWFTGLSGAGKSTLAEAVSEKFNSIELAHEILDGDVVRTNLSKGLGFSKEDRDTNIRERTYYPQAQFFILTQALVYAAVALVVSRQRQREGSGSVARWAVLAVASYPAATFVVKAFPWATANWVALPSVLAIIIAGALAWVASRRKGHPLAGFQVVLAATVGVIVFDAATGTWLHLSSWLGYSLHSAGRFYGMPNTTFAVLGACALLLAASWVHHANRRSEAVVAAGGMPVVIPPLGAELLDELLPDGAPLLLLDELLLDELLDELLLDDELLLEELLLDEPLPMGSGSDPPQAASITPSSPIRDICFIMEIAS